MTPAMNAAPERLTTDASTPCGTCGHGPGSLCHHAIVGSPNAMTFHPWSLLAEVA
jgi:hypothetical protein